MIWELPCLTFNKNIFILLTPAPFICERTCSFRTLGNAAFTSLSLGKPQINTSQNSPIAESSIIKISRPVNAAK